MNPPAKSAVYLVYGNHRLLVEEELRKMQAKIAEKDDTDLNLEAFEAGVDSFEEALQAAETLPFGSDKRYVIVKEAQKLTAGEVKRLARYMEDPAESSLLILAAVELKPTSSLAKAVEKGGRVREVTKRRDQIPGWIRSRFKERSLPVSGKAIAYLQEALGDDLMAIEGAVEKISLYHEGEEAVELDEVVLLVTPSAERSMFELVDRVALGDADQALKLMRRLLQQGERTTFMLTALARRFRMLLLYRALREDGHQDADIIAYLKLPKNQVWMVSKKFKPQAARFDEERMRQALSLLVKVDAGIKTGEMDEEFALELAVTGLAALAAGKTLQGAILL
ncbi:MAG: DNA polymerase III subunit delta [Actinobacteria bacterium]|jgi:DNA polymerase-3 subunit delta|nr:MAG: DNA polymerase III subunit delta [Actinomycetota bacterium]